MAVKPNRSLRFLPAAGIAVIASGMAAKPGLAEELRVAKGVP